MTFCLKILSLFSPLLSLYLFFIYIIYLFSYRNIFICIVNYDQDIATCTYTYESNIEDINSKIEQQTSFLMIFKAIRRAKEFSAILENKAKYTFCPRGIPKCREMSTFLFESEKRTNKVKKNSNILNSVKYKKEKDLC